jgi:hypothetical protein
LDEGETNREVDVETNREDDQNIQDNKEQTH